MKMVHKTLILIALIAISIFTSCSSSDSKENTNTSNSYIIYALENKDIPSSAQLLAQTADTKIKITRDVESEIMNVYVISGSVEVSETTVE